MLEQLDLVIVRQQQQIDHLLRELARLQPPSTERSIGLPRNPCDDRPPHY